MLVSQALNDKINEQVGHEFAASIQYTAIAAHFDAESLPYLARHFYKQAAEEHQHAMKFIKFLIDTGARVEIPAITKPVAKFPFAEDAVKLSLEQEIKVTNLINSLMDCALKENNHIASTFLQWFVTEQLEEVSSMDNLLKIVQRAGEGRLLLVEQYLAGYKSGGSFSAHSTEERA
ncbi:ferritin [soil metagenome]